MSAILAVCGDAFCAMVSDGRMAEEPVLDGKPRILTEKLPKVRKLNRNVCVGFAGDTLAAVQILNALDEYDVRCLTLERTVRILQRKGRETPCQPVGVRLLVGGRGRKGGFMLAGLGSDRQYEAQARLAAPGAYLIEGACSHTGIAPFLERYVRPAAASWRSLEEIAATLDGCIAAIAAQDPTVNTTFFRELVR